MGVTRAPVAGSGSAPAWTRRVSRPQALFVMIRSFTRGVRPRRLGARNGMAANPTSPVDFQTAGPARNFSGYVFGDPGDGYCSVGPGTPPPARRFGSPAAPVRERRRSPPGSGVPSGAFLFSPRPANLRLTEANM